MRHAVHNKEGYVVTYAEHYMSEWTVQQHAEKIKQDELELLKLGIIPFVRVADPAIKQRQQTTGLSIQIEYANHGVNLATAQRSDVASGLDKMNNYLRLGKWFITEDCPMLQREMRKYRHAQYATSKLREQHNKKEDPLKKDDHAIDSCRYFFSFMPDLNPLTPEPAAIVAPNVLGAPTINLNFLGSNVESSRFDTSLSNFPSNPIVSDEYTGEW
jgi:hypothetical protein